MPVIQQRLTSVSVLVVDDDPDARALLQLVLQLDGANVWTAESVDEALRLFLRMPPDVLVSDICMPKRSGYDLLDAVRMFDAGASVSSVALTAFPGVEHRDRALAAGFDTYLSKPLDPYELVGVVAGLVGRADSSTREEARR